MLAVNSIFYPCNPCLSVIQTIKGPYLDWQMAIHQHNLSSRKEEILRSFPQNLLFIRLREKIQSIPY